MTNTKRLPVVLSIGGSDPCAGAGIQADLKTFQALGVYGVTAVTAITVQNTVGVSEIYYLSTKIVADQIGTLAADSDIRSVKIGMLGNADIVENVVEQLVNLRLRKIVVDPIFNAHTGQILLDSDGKKLLVKRLIPMAEVITPNLDEAATIIGREINELDGMKAAAKEIHSLGAKNVLIKGGHTAGAADDVFYDGREVTILSGERIKIEAVHGTGCALSSAIAAGLGQGKSVIQSVKEAKAFVTQAIEGALKVGTGREVANVFLKSDCL